MSSTPRTHDSRKVQAFLDSYSTCGELCRAHHRIEDIFSGALELKTAGDSSTRSLSRRALFHVLQSCGSINVASINTVTNGRYAYCTLASYAAAARVASKAIERYIGRLPSADGRLTLKQEQHLLDSTCDAPFLALAGMARQPFLT